MHSPLLTQKGFISLWVHVISCVKKHSSLALEPALWTKNMGVASCTLSFGQETCYEQSAHPASCPIPDRVTQARSSLWVRKHLEIGSPFLANAFPGNARVSPPFCKGHYIASCTKIKSDLTELATATEVLFPRGSPSAVCMHYSSAAHKE